MRDPECQVGKFVRRVLNVCLHGFHQGGYAAQARDNGAKAVGRGRERPLHQAVNSAARQLDVVHRIVPP